MSKIDDITLDDIYLFIEKFSGKTDYPAEKQPVMDYMELLDKIRAMDNREGDFGSERHIIKYLVIKEGLSEYKAKRAYSDAMEFYYCDSYLSKEALRNRIAKKFEEGIVAAKLMAKDAKELTMANKLYEVLYKMLGLDKEDAPKTDANNGKLVALYSYDMKTLGLDSVVDKEAVKKFIEEAPLTEREKQLAMQEALILPLKLFPAENENLRKSE
ncbi:MULTISPECIES: hypothetical protein [Empedobacter]|uniref:Uncharacterized protein n=1 Tax=Empedobacter falsenii TaxID=343874 RepID=A0A3R8ZAG8_9FLAO|nr:MULTISPECIES: hypothetical protein [Empedobacter]RRT94175.1 hypothetical protein EGI89_02070 [Empedobacter falsenii]RRT94369.1 hypothetical protein EGI88_02075 [Empedobacter falsenii]